MASAEVRTQVSLPAQLHRRLREAARLRGVTMADLLRQGAKAVLQDGQASGPLDQLLGIVDDAPTDLAERHDQYLSGTDRKNQRRVKR